MLKYLLKYCVTPRSYDGASCGHAMTQATESYKGLHSSFNPLPTKPLDENDCKLFETHLHISKAITTVPKEEGNTRQK